MKKVLAKFGFVLCAAACVFTAACAGNGGKSTLLGKPSDFKPLTSQENSDEGLNSLRKKANSFSSEFTAAAYNGYKNGENFAVSPVSVFSALSLAAECAAGETRTEILSALGVSYQDLQNDFSKLFRSLNEEFTISGRGGKEQLEGKIQLTNSIWLDEAASAKQQCIDALSKDYFCYSYAANFQSANAEANKAVSEFVKEKTNGLIDNDFHISSQTLFTLINTLYLKDVWNEGGKDLGFTDGKHVFTEADGTVKNINLLSGHYFSGRAYDGGNFTSFYTETENRFCLKFILPKDGFALADVFTAENIAKVNSVTDYNAIDYENKIKYMTRCLFPEYGAGYDNDISPLLKDMGIKALFDKNKCDFSNLSDDKLACSQVRHVTNLQVDKKGIEGAAVTVIQMDGMPAPEFEEVYLDFAVDKAFGFIINDGDGVQLFSGAVNKV
ncbi:MAG: hypothetical protein K2O41_01505 [Clostridia bacterium]|nr:hypothetical protein [Clostridia bacterium]